MRIPLRSIRPVGGCNHHASRQLCARRKIRWQWWPWSCTSPPEGAPPEHPRGSVWREPGGGGTADAARPVIYSCSRTTSTSRLTPRDGVAVFGRGTGDVRLEPALDRPKAGSIGICTNPSGTSQKNARQVTQLRRRHGHAAAGVDLDRSNSREEARRPDCVQFFVSDLPADEGCSERPLVSSEMPVPEPLAPHGMGSGIGLGRCFCHRHALRSYA